MVVWPATPVGVTLPAGVTVANVVGEPLKVQVPPLFDVGAASVNACDVVFMSLGTVKATDTTVGMKAITRLKVDVTLVYFVVAA